MKLALILALLRDQWRNVATKNGAALYRLSWCGAAFSLSLLVGLCCGSWWPWHIVTAVSGLTLVPLSAFLSWLTWPKVQDRLLRSGNKHMAIHYLRDDYDEESRRRNATASSPSKNTLLDIEEFQIQIQAFRRRILSEAYPCYGDLLKRPNQLHPLAGGFYSSPHTEMTITFTCTVATPRLMPGSEVK